jgi:hypothetical protein
LAQTVVAVTALKDNNYAPVLAADLKVNMVAADNVNGNSFALTGREILLISNPDVSAHTVTISSAPDALGRTGDITSYNIPVGEIHAIACSTVAGWQASGGVLIVTANSALVKLGILKVDATI